MEIKHEEGMLGTPERIRTSHLSVRSGVLFQMSYECISGSYFF